MLSTGLIVVVASLYLGGLFLLALLWHTWIGIRDVILDYVPNVVSRMMVYTIVASVLVGSGLWGIRTLFLIVAI